MEKSHIPISTKILLMKALVWHVATYGCESWTLRKNEETRLDAFEMKGLRKRAGTMEKVRPTLGSRTAKEQNRTCVDAVMFSTSHNH